MAYKRTSYKKASRKGTRRRSVKRRRMYRTKKRSTSAPVRKYNKMARRWVMSSKRAYRIGRMPSSRNSQDYAVYTWHGQPAILSHPNGTSGESAFSFDDFRTFFVFTLDRMITGIDNKVYDVDLYNLATKFREFRIKRVQITLVPNPILAKGIAGPVGASSRPATGTEDLKTTYANNWGKYVIYPYDQGVLPLVTNSTVPGQTMQPVNDVINHFRRYTNAKIRNHNKGMVVSCVPRIQEPDSDGSVVTKLRMKPAPWLQILHTAAPNLGQAVVTSNTQEHFTFAMFSQGSANSLNPSNSGYRIYSQPLRTDATDGTDAHWASFTVYSKAWIEFRHPTRPTSNIAI